MMFKANVQPSRDIRNNNREIEQYLHDQSIYKRLQKTKTKMCDPNVPLSDTDDVLDRIKQKHKKRKL